MEEKADRPKLDAKHSKKTKKPPLEVKITEPENENKKDNRMKQPTLKEFMEIFEGHFYGQGE